MPRPEKEVGYVWVDAFHWYKPNPMPAGKMGEGRIEEVTHIIRLGKEGM